MEPFSCSNSMQASAKTSTIDKYKIEIYQCSYGLGKQFVLPKNDHIISHATKTMRWWEYSFIINLYKATVERNGPGAYFDIGANIGTSSVLASEVFDHIYAFEIDLKNCELFCYAMEINKAQYSLYNVAVSNQSGQAEVFLDESNHGGHSIVSKNGVAPSIKVDKVSLNEFNPEVTNVRFLHIDTEGHDFKVLSGCYEFIARQDSRPIIEFEFQPSSLIRHESSIDELLSFMDTFNFSAYINAANVLAPISRATLTDMFYMWKPTIGWIDIYLLPH